MDLNEDFIAIQGIFLSAEKSPGLLKKIKYRGGNELIVLHATTELHKFLSSKNYMCNNKINNEFESQLKNICLFLIVNTETKTGLNKPEYQHLINIMPQLSSCLLANVIVALDLSPFFCSALQGFSLDIIAEFLQEMIPCIKKCKPKIHLNNAYEFLKLIIVKVSSSNDNDGVEKLSDVAAQMLLNLTGLHGEQVENVRISSVYECMGYTLLHLLDLLLMSNEKNSMLKVIIEKLLKTCCCIVGAITIDVFCSWAEVELNGQVLQTLVAEKSYMVMMKYEKNPVAKEVINMLGSIARKPESVQAQIYRSDVPKMISMINKADVNQKQWFTALLNTQVLKCKDSIQCINRWAHLCVLGDVSRLLNLSVLCTDPDGKSVVVKCAATLDFGELILATTRHFYQNGINKNLKDNIQDQLVLLFNKMKDKTISEEFSKELYLLLLQNQKQTINFIFAECLKNSFYSSNLSSVWPHIKEIITIDNFGIQSLNNEVNNFPPNEHNCKSYVELLNILIDMGVFSAEIVALQVILPLLQDSCSKENCDILKLGLEILKDLHGNTLINPETEYLFNFLLDLMKNFRSNLMNFDGSKHEIARLSVEIIEKYQGQNWDNSYSIQPIKSEGAENSFVSYYKKILFGSRSEDDNILKHFFPINFENHAETVAHLIKILPLCVTPEWVMIVSSLVEVQQSEKTIVSLCDSLILICEVVNNQESNRDEISGMLNGLKHCLQNFGVAIKECILPRIRNLQEDVALTKNVCRLLREIPSGPLKSEEGLSLASLLSDASLKSLRPDMKFAWLLASIHESHISKMLAQKILS